MSRRKLAEGDVLWDAGEISEHIYFPRSGMIAIRVPTRDGTGVEVAVAQRLFESFFTTRTPSARPPRRSPARRRSSAAARPAPFVTFVVTRVADLAACRT